MDTCYRGAQIACGVPPVPPMQMLSVHGSAMPHIPTSEASAASAAESGIIRPVAPRPLLGRRINPSAQPLQKKANQAEAQESATQFVDMDHMAVDLVSQLPCKGMKLLADGQF